MRKIYKSILPWRLRTIIHGLLDSLLLGSRVALQHARVSVGVASRAIGNISDLPVYPEMVEIFREVDADIYVVPGNNQISATVAWFCKQNRRAYVMLAGSDKDFSPDILDNPKGVNIYGDSNEYRLYSLRNAAAHIVQNDEQVILAEAFGVKPYLIPSPVDLELKYPKTSLSREILWVGNSNEKVKQPSVMVDLIKQLPSYPFIMIVTPIVEEDFKHLEEILKILPNVRMLSRIPYEEIEQYFARAKLLVNTSQLEGFPNTFLQAGKYGVPIVSLQVDPNDMLSKHRCGLLCGGDKRQLLNDVVKLITDESLYHQLSSNILSYVRENHDKNRVIPLFEAAFRNVLSKNSQG